MSRVIFYGVWFIMVAGSVQWCFDRVKTSHAVDVRAKILNQYREQVRVEEDLDAVEEFIYSELRQEESKNRDVHF